MDVASGLEKCKYSVPKRSICGMKSLLLGEHSVSLAVRLVGECLRISCCSMQTPCNHRNLVAIKAITRRGFSGGGGDGAITGGFSNRFHRYCHQPLSKIHILSSQLVNDRRSSRMANKWSWWSHDRKTLNIWSD